MEGNTNNYLSPDCRFGKLYSSEGKVGYYSQNIANSKVNMFGIKYSPVPFPLCLETQGETTGEPFSSKGQVRSETLSCPASMLKDEQGRSGKSMTCVVAQSLICLSKERWVYFARRGQETGRRRESLLGGFLRVAIRNPRFRLLASRSHGGCKQEVPSRPRA